MYALIPEDHHLLLDFVVIESYDNLSCDIDERMPYRMIAIPERNIDNLIVMMRNYNIFPYQLDSYVYDSSESTHPIYPVLQEILTIMGRFLCAETESELAIIHQSLSWYWHEQISEDFLRARDSNTISRLGLYIVIDTIQSRYFKQQAYISEDYLKKSLVFDKFPELAAYQSDEELLSLDAPGIKLTEHGINYKNHVLYYHQFLRRNFTSNINSDFILALLQYHQAHKGQPVSVAIDHLRLVPQQWFQPAFEKDYWYGPPLNWKLIDDKYEVGLTVHGSSNNALHDIDRTEFIWSYRHDLKSLQIEEIHGLKLLDDPHKDLILNRYIHSQRDVANGAFMHLDGAVKVYERDSYQHRYNNKWTEAHKSTYKPKLFRIDDPINDEEWARLVTHFFRGNEMIAEYLNK